jgi:hypothetical protein
VFGNSILNLDIPKDLTGAVTKQNTSVRRLKHNLLVLLLLDQLVTKKNTSFRRLKLPILGVFYDPDYLITKQSTSTRGLKLSEWFLVAI